MAAPEPGAVVGAAFIWRPFIISFAAPETAPKLRSPFSFQEFTVLI
jgi:hypothetical protein